MDDIIQFARDLLAIEESNQLYLRNREKIYCDFPAIKERFDAICQARSLTPSDLKKNIRRATHKLRHPADPNLRPTYQALVTEIKESQAEVANLKESLKEAKEDLERLRSALDEIIEEVEEKNTAKRRRITKQK